MRIITSLTGLLSSGAVCAGSICWNRESCHGEQRFSSLDLQVLKKVNFHVLGKKHKAKVGMSVFNLLNRSDPRKVQNIAESYRFGSFLNPLDRTFRGKFILEF